LILIEFTLAQFTPCYTMRAIRQRNNGMNCASVNSMSINGSALLAWRAHLPLGQ